MTHPQVVRAISIRQPYVELILLGVKKREYRSIPTNIRERVYIYASLKPGEDWEKNAHHLGGAKPGDLPTDRRDGRDRRLRVERENQGVRVHPEEPGPFQEDPESDQPAAARLLETEVPVAGCP